MTQKEQLWGMEEMDIDIGIELWPECKSQSISLDMDSTNNVKQLKSKMSRKGVNRWIDNSTEIPVQYTANKILL